MTGIVVNKELIFDLTSDYARKYNTIPETGKQAIQWAYEQGKAKAIDEFAERLKDSLVHNYRHLLKTDTDGFEWLTTDAVHTHIDKIAEEMRGAK